MAGPPATESSTAPALFDAYPALATRLPWRALGRFPTRLQRLDGLVSPRVELWVKRDDESSPLYGGNKVRKLEFLLGGALARGRERVATLGGWGSHHVLATALHARSVGLATAAVLFPQPLSDHVREVLRCDAAAGVELHPAWSYLDVLPRVAGLRLRRRCDWIPAGGSSVIGTLGYVSAALELAGQIARQECPPPDVIYVALGSCGSAAGIALGLRLAGLRARVIAVRVVERAVTNLARTRALARGARRLIDPAAASAGVDDELDLTVDHRFFGGAYGRSTPAAMSAVAVAAAHGLTLEPTYTGKTFAALLADAAAGQLDGQRALYLHTFNSADLTPLVATSPGPAALQPRLRRLFDAT